MIKGVIIKKLNKFTDERGWLTEIYRKDEDDLRPVMSYVSFTNFGKVRGPHEHVKQSDFFVFIGSGDFELHLWDNRKDSETYGEKVEVVVGESEMTSVIVPPGVVHGYKCISEKGGVCINLPDALYAGESKKEDVDEIRHEEGDTSEFKIE